MFFSIYFLLRVQMIGVRVENMSDHAFRNFCQHIINDDGQRPEARTKLTTQNVRNAAAQNEIFGILQYQLEIQKISHVTRYW
jgi:hypothetical protein